ncbi:MAG: hypothetical protein IPK82_39980 [Polyangiaceae bacterium]|nr:hypothetical protein [Polyangiaceae bacterium]
MGSRRLCTQVVCGVAWAFFIVCTAACTKPSEARFSANAASLGPTGAAPTPLRPDQPGVANVVGVNCDVGECQASCVQGSTILLAYGFHGRTYDSGGPISTKCGEGMEWLGGCIGQESCTVTTACKTSAMYLICR